MNSIAIVAIVCGCIVAICGIVFDPKRQQKFAANKKDEDSLDQQAIEELSKLLDKLENRIEALETIVINQKTKQ